MISVLSGPNAFQLRNNVQKITQDFVAEHGDLALEKLDAPEVTYNQILGAIESLPFLASKKMVVVEDLSLNKEASEQVEKLVERAGESTDLIIVESKLDKRSVYYKQLKKMPGFHEYNELEEHQLAEWLTAEATAMNAKLARTDAQYLVQRVGANQLRLSRELEKLIQYDPAVTKKTIDLLTEENPSSTIFNLIDSVFSGNLTQALRIYDEQRMQRIEPQAIHGMLVWQMHAVAIAAAAPSSANHAQIARDSGISPFVIQKSQRIARNMGRAKIREFTTLL
ncbi:MAG: DNA polymerase III subunit delta, partial [Candidatus Saccharimonadales bacterium]